MNAATGLMEVAAGNGNHGYFGDGGPAADATFESVWGLAIDPNGNLYIADPDDAVIREVIYSTTPIAATPTFSPAAGTYSSSQSVILSDATAGAIIYYTTDGSTPTTSSFEYGGAIPVKEATTIEAIAVATGYTNSAVASATYTITPPAATPVFSPAAGTYTTAVIVTITDSTAGATIYYTTNGTTPTATSTKYTGPITVSTRRRSRLWLRQRATATAR